MLVVNFKEANFVKSKFKEADPRLKFTTEGKTVEE